MLLLIIITGFSHTLDIWNPSQFLLAEIHPSKGDPSRVNAESEVQTETAPFPV